jgi:hypothetical protein
MKAMSLALTTFRAFLFLVSFPGTEKQLVRLVKGVIDWWSGKKIAVIGPTASGKDSFLARLQNREIPEVHSNSPKEARCARANGQKRAAPIRGGIYRRDLDLHEEQADLHARHQ